MARGVYHDYKDTVKDMVEAGDDLGTALQKKGDSLIKKTKVSFRKVVKKNEDLKENKQVEDGAEFAHRKICQLKDNTLIFNLEYEDFCD